MFSSGWEKAERRRDDIIKRSMDFSQGQYPDDY